MAFTVQQPLSDWGGSVVCLCACVCAHQCDVGQRCAVLQPSVACWRWCVSDINLCVLVLSCAWVLLGGQAA
jgi:hypothetical protein